MEFVTQSEVEREVTGNFPVVGDEVSIARKVKEAILAVQVTRTYSKEQILELYLNEVYFGNGAYGVAVAAQEYFRVDPGDLTVEQAALLAALIRAPGALDPRDNLERAKERRDWLLAGMAEEGWLDPDEARSLADVPLEVEPPLERQHREPYVVEAVKRAFLDDPTFGEDRRERIQRLFTGGLHIHTTIDRDLQAIAAQVVETGVAHGGSLIHSASLLELLGGDRLVIGVDVEIRPHNRYQIERHPLAGRIRLIEGSSTDPAVAAAVAGHARGRQSVMVVLDSDHTHAHVLRELQLYAPLVTRESYLVVFDTLIEDLPAELFAGRAWGKGNNPKTAVWEFLAGTTRFEIDPRIPAKLLLTCAPDGFLRCVG